MSETEESGFQKFVSESLRGPKGGSWESLLAQHLVAGVTSKPLSKIRLTCEGALMLEDLKSKDIDKEELDIIHKVALGFINTSHYQQQGAFWCYMSFPFEPSEENYEKFIQPWCGSLRLKYHLTLQFYLRPRDYERICQEVYEKVRRLEQWQFFFHITQHQNLVESSFNHLLSQFVSWALPKTQRTFAKLAKMVNPGLYKEILSLYQGERKREEVPGEPKI